MLIYISKNNQQARPFEEVQVLEMLKNGQLSPNDLAIRQGENQWQSLGNLFPNVIPFKPLATSSMTNGISNKSGCRMVFGTILLIFGIVIFAGGLFFPAKVFLMGSGQSYFCREAENAKQDADETFNEYEKAKGTSRETEKAQELKSKITILEDRSKTCSETNSSFRRWNIGLTMFGLFGFVIAIIGFFVRRRKMFI